MSQEQKIDPGIVKKTQDTLGRVIQAPALTEKLLNRPPVQFIQDIVKSVIKNTGFMKGLYKSDELEAAFIKESKDNKLLFLNKFIIVVGIVIGQQLSVKASKIAAGVEAEKTNDLLQNLAKAVNMKPDNDEVVKKALKMIKSMESGGDIEKEEKSGKEKREKERDDEKESRRDREKERPKEKEKERSKQDDSRERGDRDRERDKAKERERRDKTGDEEKQKDREREKDNKERDREKDRNRDRERDRRDKEKERPKEESKEREKTSRDKDRKEKEEREREKESSKRVRDSSRKEREQPEKDSQKSASVTKERSLKGGRRGSNDDDDFNKTSNQKHEIENGSSKRNDNSESENQSENDANAARKRPSSAKGPRSLIEQENQANQRFQDSEDRGLRPTTARPGAPRPRLRNEPEEPIQSKINTSSKAKSTLIVNSDSDDDFVVKEQKIQEDENKKKI